MIVKSRHYLNIYIEFMFMSSFILQAFCEREDRFILNSCVLLINMKQ